MLRQSGNSFNPANVNITGGSVSISTLNATSTITGVSITATGAITPNASIGVIGTTAANNANAGSVGEFVAATVAAASSISLTNATPANVTSINLTGGDWDVTGIIDLSLAGATVTDLRGGPSVATATLPTQAGGSGLGTDALMIFPSNLVSVTDTIVMESATVRVSVGATTPVFLVGQATFSLGTVAAFGTLRARRMR